ncbi:MAG: hypothetical protein AAFX85_13930 [Pseudomonadota bacterium]
MGSLYVTLNRPMPIPVPNALGCRALGNNDFDAVTRLPFDLDPVRPSGVSSTDTELTDAIKRRDGLVAMLRKTGWPAPLVATSGNGAHAVYRVRLPNNAETAEQFREIYRGLAREFGDDVVAFDTTVRNPGRIWRLYGTTNRKGLATPERPHRVAQCWIPHLWSRVRAQQIESLAEPLRS